MNIGREVNGIKQRIEEDGFIGKEIGYKELQGIYNEYGGGMSELDFAKGVLNISYAGYSDLKYGNAKITLLSSPVETNDTIRKEKVNKVEKVVKLDSYAVENKSVFENYNIDKMSKSNLDLNIEEKNDTYKRYPVDLKPRDDVDSIIENEENTEENTNDKTNEKEEKIYTKEELENIYSKNYLTMLKLISFGKSNCDENLLNKYNEENMWFGKTTMSKDFVNSNWDTIIKITESALNNTKKRYGANYSKGKSNSDLIQEAAFYLVKNRGDIEKNFKGNDDIVKKLVYLSVSRYINCEAINIVGIDNPKAIVNKTYKIKVDNIEENKESYDIGELLAIKKELENSKKDVILEKEKVAVEENPINEIKEKPSDGIKEISVEETDKKEEIVPEKEVPITKEKRRSKKAKKVESDCIKETLIEETDNNEETMPKKEDVVIEETPISEVKETASASECIKEIPIEEADKKEEIVPEKEVSVTKEKRRSKKAKKVESDCIKETLIEETDNNEETMPKKEDVVIEETPISEVKETASASECIKEIPIEEIDQKEKIVIEESPINEIKEVASDYIKEIPIEETDKKEEIIVEETTENKIESIPINEIPVDDETKTLVEEIINKENATSMGENLTEPAIDNENVILKKEVKINYEELIKKEELSKQFGNENLETDIGDIKEELIDENPDENQNNSQEKFGEEKLGMREKTILASMRMYLVSDGKIKISNNHLGKKDGDEN